MGLRETLNQNPGITTGVTAGIIVLALAIILWQALGGGGGPSTSSTTKMFYSDDDGATWFADDIKKLPPFDHNGKPAVRARIFSCNGKKFVGYLERYTADAKSKIEKAAGKSGNFMAEDIALTGMEVKKPQSKDPWVKQMDQKAGPIMNVTCPDGKRDDLQVVMP